MRCEADAAWAATCAGLRMTRLGPELPQVEVLSLGFFRGYRCCLDFGVTLACKLVARLCLSNRNTRRHPHKRDHDKSGAWSCASLGRPLHSGLLWAGALPFP